MTNNDLAFEIDAKYKDYQILGKVQYIDGEIVANLKTTIFEKEILFDYQNQTIYVDIDGLKLYIEQSKLKDFAEEFKNYLNLDFDKIKNIDIKEVLNSIQILIDSTILELNYDNLNVKLNSETLQIDAKYNDFEAKLCLKQKFEKTEKQNYINLFDLKPVLKAVLNTLQTKNISGKINVTLNLFNEDNNLDINYQISFASSNILAKINTIFKGLNVNIYINNKDIYIDIVGLKVHFNIDQIPEIIDFVNNTFETNINFDANELLNKDEIYSKIKNIDFDFINSLSTSNGKLMCNVFDNLNIEVDFDEFINKVEFEHKTRKATILCTNFETIDFSDINVLEYKDYTVFEKLLKSTNNLIKSKKYNIQANVSKFNDESQIKNINAKINLDITGVLNAFVDCNGLDQPITLAYENKMLYLCYGGQNGIKIKIREDAVQEILSIALNALNVDTSSIPYLNEFLSKTDIDSINLETILPKIELKNPLNYLEYIQNFEVNDNYFAIILKADKLGKFAKGKDIAIKLNYQNSKITSVVVNDLYLNSELNEHYNFEILIKDFEEVETILDKEKYLDLSDSKDLIRAFVNTSNLNNWHINGKIKLDIKLGDLEIKAATVNVDIKVKLDQNKKPIIEANITGYPLIGLVNNKNTNGVGGTGLGLISTRNRSILICYKNGEFYLKTRDEKWGAYKELIRTTKISTQTMFDNLSYYVQYLLGFTDSIQAKINEAIQKSQSYEGETNYSNIIEEYSKSGTSHTIKINLKELAHNDDIGTLSLVLKTLSNQTTNNKDYIHRVDVDLRLLNDLMILRTETTNSDSGLYLTDIGKDLTLSEAENLFALYDNGNFGLDGEYEKEGTSAWRQENSGSRTVTFVYNGEIVSVQTGNIAQTLTKPEMQNIVIDDGVVVNEYAFVGWFLDENCTNQFTANTIPRYDTTLYAKYELSKTKYYATIHFETGESINVDDLKGFVGDSFVLPVLQNVEIIIDENTSLLKTFVCWQTADGKAFEKTIFEHSYLVLKAKWQEKTTKTYLVTIYSAQKEVYNTKVEANIEFVFPNLECFNETTKYYTSPNFEEETLVTNFVVNENKVWYARNKFSIKVSSKYSTQNGGEVVSINDYFYEG